MQENFLIPMIGTKPPLVAYLERNSLFNFDEMVLDYVKTVIGSPALYISFKTIIADCEIFTNLTGDISRTITVRVNPKRNSR